MKCPFRKRITTNETVINNPSNLSKLEDQTDTMKQVITHWELCYKKDCPFYSKNILGKEKCKHE